MRKNLVVLVLLLTICLSPIFAQRRPTATFLLIPPTAKASGMGYAWSAICDDASANYYNAAGIVFLNLSKFTINYFKYLPALSDMHYIYVGLAYPLITSGWGFDFTYFTRELPDYYWQGQYIGTYTSYRLAPKISYSKKIFDNLAVGIGWKYIYQKYGEWNDFEPELGLEGTTGSSWAFDFNLLYKISPNLSIGSVLHNWGPNMEYAESGATDPLPLTYRLGIACKLIDIGIISVTISGEITKMLAGIITNKTKSFKENLEHELKEAWKGGGLEASFYRILSLRIGYFYDYEGKREGLTYGGGINLEHLEFDVGIDEKVYDFPTQNRKLSLSFSF